MTRCAPAARRRSGSLTPRQARLSAESLWRVLTFPCRCTLWMCRRHDHAGLGDTSMRDGSGGARDYIWQWPIPGTPYVADFYIPSRKLIIEVESPTNVRAKKLTRAVAICALGHTLVHLPIKAVDQDVRLVVEEALGSDDRYTLDEWQAIEAAGRRVNRR